MSGYSDTSGADLFFFFASLFVLAFGLAGFAPGFFAALFEGYGSIPWVVHLHGALMVGWLCILTTQSFLIWRGPRQTHRVLGRVATVWFAAAYFTLVFLAFNNLVKEVPPFVDEALSKIFALQIRTLIFVPLLFAVAVYAAFRDTQTHKRLMLLISAMMVEAAVVRMHWLPGINGLRSELWVMTAYSLIPLLPLPVYEFWRTHRMHIATFGVLVLVFFAKAFAFWAWSSEEWLGVTTAIEQALAPLWPGY